MAGSKSWLPLQEGRRRPGGSFADLMGRGAGLEGLACGWFKR
ncbi:hypothetical protein [Thermogemmatispora sp.]